MFALCVSVYVCVRVCVCLFRFFISLGNETKIMDSTLSCILSDKLNLVVSAVGVPTECK